MTRGGNLSIAKLSHCSMRETVFFFTVLFLVATRISNIHESALASRVKVKAAEPEAVGGCSGSGPKSRAVPDLHGKSLSFAIARQPFFFFGFFFWFLVRVQRLHYLHNPTSLHRHMYASRGPPNSHEQRERESDGGCLPLKPVSICRVLEERIGQRSESKTRH